MARKKKSDPGPGAAPRLRIGAVSRLTKIPVDTLRGWERRYGVVAPARADSTARLYGPDDVERLKRIKQLVDNGHAIGSVATLSRRKLEAMSALHVSAPLASALPPGTSEAIGMVAFGDALPRLDVARMHAGGVTLLGQHTRWDAFEADVLQLSVQALVIEVGAMLPDDVERVLGLVWRSQPVRTLVFYGFAPAALVNRLLGEGIVALRAPVEHALLLRELGRLGGDPPDRRLQQDVACNSGDQSPPMFDMEALAELAAQSTSVKCECPHHLVEIVRTLTQFEQYSAACAHRNDEDAALHLELRASTARARRLMERALLDVAEHEGIALPAGVRGEDRSESA